MEKFAFIIVSSIIFFVICSLLVKLIKRDTWISFKLALVNDAFPLFIGITSWCMHRNISVLSKNKLERIIRRCKCHI